MRRVTEGIVYALSARSFSQADMPLGFALRLYDAFSAAVQRKWTCWVARSLSGKGGRPLPRLGAFMADIMPTQIIIDKALSRLYCVYTLNQEADMETKPIQTEAATIKHSEWMAECRKVSGDALKVSRKAKHLILGSYEDRMVVIPGWKVMLRGCA